MLQDNLNTGTSGHRTLTRALDILELISQHKGGLSFSDICQRLDIPKSSLHPLLHTLNARRYLYFNAQLQRYFLGGALFTLGNLYTNSIDIHKELQGLINCLSARVGETVYLGIRQGSEVLYLAKAEPDIAVHIMTAGVGYRLPAYCTGLGKALLMDHSLEQLYDLYPNGLEALTPNTITSVDELCRQLTMMRNAGFTSEKEESTIGIQCIAVPIRIKGKVVASISSSVPIFRFTPELSCVLKEQLLQTAEKMAALISSSNEAWSRLCPAE